MLHYPMKRPPLLGALALSALLLSACAPVVPRPSAAGASVVQDTGGQADYSAGMSPMQPIAPPVANVRELRDGELSCAEIYAETQALDKTGRQQEAKVRQAQEVMAKLQEKMTKQSSGMSTGLGLVGSGLLGRSPGGSLVSGLAMQAASSARTASIEENTNKMMQTQTELMNTEMALQHTQARKSHLADLFLDKGCKLSEVEAAAKASP